MAPLLLLLLLLSSNRTVMVDFLRASENVSEQVSIAATRRTTIKSVAVVDAADSHARPG